MKFFLFVTRTVVPVSITHVPDKFLRWHNALECIVKREVEPEATRKSGFIDLWLGDIDSYHMYLLCNLDTGQCSQN